MSQGKWIDGLTAATTVADAARVTLGTRLKLISKHLQPALEQPSQDTESVHQLRVATRRAGAALRIFSLCLPEKIERQAKRQLRRLRRGAGQARDWDVFLEALARRQRRDKKKSGSSGLLMGYALGQRLAAQDALRTAVERLPEDFSVYAQKIVDAIDAPGEHSEMRTLVDLASPTLEKLLGELEEAAARDLKDYDNLHAVRIAGKQLRYAMEIFVECFHADFREVLYTEIETMQDILGRANDSHVASHRMKELREFLQAADSENWKQFAPEIDSLLLYHRRRLPQERLRFIKWWRQWHESGKAAALAAHVKWAPASTM